MISQKKDIQNIDERIPIIDLSILFNKNNGKEIISKKINDACKEYGFFYIINHAIEQSIIDNLIEYTKKYFELPSEVKNKMKINVGENESNLGYFSLGSHYTGGMDYKEGTYLDLENENNKHIYLTKEEEKLYDLVGFKETCQTMLNKLNNLCKQMMGLIALSLNLPEDYFNERYLENPHFNIGLLRYMSFNKSENKEDLNKFGNGPHCDWSLITLLYQEDNKLQNFLQVKSKKTGEWINATPINGSFVVNIGDMLEIISKGNYISNYHRVLYNECGKDRYSFPFFYNPQLDKPIVPIESLNKNKNFQKDPELLNFKGTYNDYHIMQMKKLIKK